MPKINGISVDPKAYAKRVTEAKKTLARTSPEVKRKIAEMYPKVSGKDIVNKALSPKLMKKNAKPIEDRKKNTPPKPRAVRLRDSKPVPMPGYKPRRVPGQPLPAPMPKVEGNYGKPRGQRTGPKQVGPAGPKKKSPGVATPKPKAKKPTLDDFLLKGKRPPMKIKPGLKRPSDADVIIKGYNDPGTIKKYKKK